MDQKLSRIGLAITLSGVALIGIVMSGLAQDAAYPIFLPLIKNEQSRQLTVCMGQEPDSLYMYGSNMYASTEVREAIYDGPMDSNDFYYQPVILSKIPSLVDDDVLINPIDVEAGDSIVDNSWTPTILSSGTIVRPAGCRSSDCAITYDGSSPLQMDQISVTFQLLPGLRWSDGARLTASDSVYSYNLAADPATPSSKYVIERTASYSALDDITTVWIGLPGYLDTTYFANFWTPLPEHIWGVFSAAELLTAEVSTKNPLGWGPYVIEEWIPGEQISLRRNPLYFQANAGLPKFTSLVYRILSGDPDEAITAVLAGECDIVDETVSLESQAELLLFLEGAGLIKAEFGLSSTWEHADFNIQPVDSIINTGEFAGWDQDGNGDGPFGDIRLRQAIAMCMDRQAVVDTALYGQSIIIDTYLLPNHPLYNSLITHWPYDPGAAAALLDEIGWVDTDGDPNTPRIAQSVVGVPDGTILSFNYETTNNALRQQVTQVLAQSLAGCGIQVNLWYHPASEWFASGPDGRLFGRKYDLGEFAWLSGIVPSCELYLSTRVPNDDNGWSGENQTGFHDLEYDNACNAQLASLPGEPAFVDAAKEAQLILSEQLPMVPLFPRLKLAITRPDICNFSLNSSALSDLWNIENFDYGEGCAK